MKLLTCFLVVVSVLMLQCSKPADEGPSLAPEDATSVNELPEMNLVTMDQQVIRARELAGKNILVFFRPECDHCQREAEAISDNLDAFAEYQIFFVGTDGHEASQKFARDYSLDGKNNVHFVQTTVNEILDRLGPISTPSLYIYSEERRLVRHLDGEVPIEAILRSL
ncbi:MAG: peroxiredoxin family protein [Cyclobacteriaceae bacterium]|jgi:thioredoxin-related protein|nr:peroxiredoxin family protein [Cyclobacteriaceae bacterium]